LFKSFCLYIIEGKTKITNKNTIQSVYVILSQLIYLRVHIFV